jgi:hypothetical protein
VESWDGVHPDDWAWCKQVVYKGMLDYLNRSISSSGYRKLSHVNNS